MQVASAIRRVNANSDQLKCTCGRAIRRGIQTIMQKSPSISAIRRVASRARRLMRMAIEIPEPY